MATIAVIGTGQIGASWTSLFLAQGHDVVATDPGAGAETRLRQAVTRAWPALETIGLSPGADPQRVRFCRELRDALAGADFVQECGPEVLTVKHDLVAAIDSVLDPTVVVASSTSGLMPSDIQAPAVYPERFLVGHPFNPPHLIPLVEVVGGVRTSEASIEFAMDFYRRVGKHPIRLRRELRGHVANRLQAAIWREAFALVASGAVSVADLDTAVSEGPGLRWALLGPFLNMHAAGGDGGVVHALEHLGGPIREWAADLNEYPESDDYIGVVAAGVDDALDGRDFDAVLRARDAVLLRLLDEKRRTGLAL